MEVFELHGHPKASKSTLGDMRQRVQNDPSGM
jgi:hypothetical protein